MGDDHITVRDITGSQAVAVGPGATAIYQGLTVAEVSLLFTEWKNADQPTVWDGRVPYMGLGTFHESDAQFFFGRERDVQDLLTRVAASQFITIAGPSGSGKSSVARAGLLHALRQGQLPKSDQWLLATMLPGDQPLENLAIAIERLTKVTGSADNLRRHGLENPQALHQQTEVLLTDDPSQRLVLLVDQFEEIFTQTKNEAEQSAFIQLLTHSAQTEGSRLTIILSLRDDFISHCARYPDLREMMNKQLLFVGAMEAHDLAKAITLPALEVGAEIDADLVSRIMADMKGEPGALPLMSFALQDLFEAEKSAVGKPLALTLPEYLNRGGIEQALERHANGVFADFTAEQKGLARGVFSKLIAVGQGRAADTRKTAVFSELIPAGQNPHTVRAVVDQLAKARLLTTSGDKEQTSDMATTVTIAHETLIDAWPWLRRLVDENREAITLQNQISYDAQIWAETQDAGYLYRGGRLLQVEEKIEGLALSLDSSQFIEASIKQRRQEQRQKQRNLAMLIGLLLILFAGSAFAALRFNEQATENEQIAATANAEATRALVAEEQAQDNLVTATIALGQAQIEQQNALAAQGTAEARGTEAALNLEQAVTSQAEAVNNANLAATQQAEAIASANLAATSEANAITSANLAATSEAEAIANADLAATREAEAQRQARLALAQSLAALSSSVYQRTTDSELAALLAIEAHNMNQEEGGSIDWLVDGGLRPLLDHAPPYFNHTLDGPEYGALSSVAFNPDGQTLASGSYDSIIRLWDLSEPTATSIVLSGHESWVHSVAFSPDGQTLASGSEDRTIRLWDLGEPTAAPIVLSGHEGSVKSVAFSPDGQTLASGSWDRTIWLWDLGEPTAAPVVLSGHESWVHSVAFSPDGQSLASGSEDRTIRLWDLDEPTAAPVVLSGHEGGVLSVTFSPNGQTLASGSWDRTIRLWDLGEPTAAPVVLSGHEDRISSVAFSIDGQTLTSGSWDNTIRLWDVGEPTAAPVILSGHESYVTSVAFSPDGQTLASGSEDKTIRLWVLLDELVEIGCQKVWRNLSWQEWQQYLPREPYRQTCPNLPPHPSVPEEQLLEVDS